MKDTDIVVRTEPDPINGMYFWFLLNHGTSNGGHGWSTSMQEAFNDATKLLEILKKDE